MSFFHSADAFAMIRGGHMLSWPLERYPEKIAIKFEGQEMTFRQVDDRINRLANGLIDLGLKKGDRVAALLDNSPRAIEVRFALMKAGLCMVALNVRQSAEENAYIINHSESSVVILDEDYLSAWELMKGHCKGVRHVVVAARDPGSYLSYEKIIKTSSSNEPEVVVSLDDLERIAYTSGTTGRPKGVMKTIGNDLARLRNDFMNHDDLITTEDIMLNVAPLTHAARALFHKYYIIGACNIILRRFKEEEVLDTIQKERVTATMFVPTMIVRLLLHPKVQEYDKSSLKRIFYGTAPMPADKLKLGIEIFGNIFRGNYGLTEATQPVILISPVDLVIDEDEKQSRRLASAGRPALGIEVRIVNEKGEKTAPGEIGEILVRGEIVMKGYWKDPEATREVLKNGWLHTGDMAKVDEDGYITIVDRRKDMIISGGFNIYPREVERVIESHPGVQDVAVIGVPDDIWGEAVKALVVPKSQVKLTEEEIIELCKSQIGSYKKPKHVEFVENLPKNFQGKIVKRVLRDQYWQGLNRRV
ncbi:MAG: long-chain-fatty-acid--CoA ligase, partial [Candidatus Binatia bacterium]